ncbi:DUF488 family protein [Granulicoccus phenolivorans]|uniref:DUF488 domain-containing protein n=1 Tax=Granulicoccus phenolivorans TaxID=266854 RepID=UPI001B7FEA71|nr:DUF488 domain-containing protein [Granulicoccus phenolivorans]
MTVRPAEPEPNGAPAAATSRVFTIGHSDRAFADVVHLLRVNQVTVLVDVRAFPSSRIHPQWNQAAIIDALPGDLTYRWIRALGGRRHTPAGTPSPNGGWRVKGFRDYADYMGTPAFAAGLEELLGLLPGDVPAIMCSEAVPWRCHRRLITDALLIRGVPVFDIVGEGQPRPARLTPFARVDGSTLTYPGPDDTA